jgi:hypothetical protein
VYVGVIHHISDPEGFEAAEERALEAGLPEGSSSERRWAGCRRLRVQGGERTSDS